MKRGVDREQGIPPWSQFFKKEKVDSTSFSLDSLTLIPGTVPKRLPQWWYPSSNMRHAAASKLCKVTRNRPLQSNLLLLPSVFAGFLIAILQKAEMHFSKECDQACHSILPGHTEECKLWGKRATWLGTALERGLTHGLGQSKGKASRVTLDVPLVHNSALRSGWR